MGHPLQPYPYRTPAKPSKAHSDSEPDKHERLGALRSVHRVPRLILICRVVVSLLGLGIAAVAAALGGRTVGLAVGLTAGIVILTMCVHPAIRDRGLRIDLHDAGVVVARGRARDITIFADIDEVWFDLDVTSTPIARIARLRALRLVEQGGKNHRVPAEVKDGLKLVHWIIRCCSYPLIAEAHRALAAGEVLSFGSTRLDARSIAIGSAHLEWNAFSLVRLQPGRIAFFRGQTVIPWRTVHLDRVPHPTLFVKLVTEYAKRVEDDGVWTGWSE